MNAKKCDICGAYYEGKPYHSIIIIKDYSPDFERKTMDICKNCAEKLEKFINSYNSGKN